MEGLPLGTLYAAPFVIAALGYGAVRRREWTLPWLAAYLGWCVVAAVLCLTAEDSYRGDGTSNWSVAGPGAQRWLLLLGVVAALSAAAAVLARRRPATRAALIGGVAAGWAVGCALLLVAGLSGLD